MQMNSQEDIFLKNLISKNLEVILMYSSYIYKVLINVDIQAIDHKPKDSLYYFICHHFTIIALNSNIILLVPTYKCYICKFIVQIYILVLASCNIDH